MNENAWDMDNMPGFTNVFISYASNEMEIAGRICRFLESNGVSCWIAPRNINPGGNYATQIVHAIRNCSALVLLASSSTNTSGHVSNEVSLAFDNKKTIIPFKLEDITFTDEYLYFLGRKHWIEAHSDMKAGLNRLLTTIKNLSSYNDGKKKAIFKAEEEKPEITLREERAFDKSKDIAEKVFTRNEISSRIMDHAVKYSNRSISRFISGAAQEETTERANAFLAKSFKTYRNNNPIEPCNLIHSLVEELVKNNADLIKIIGMPGSGKSVLLQAAFYELLTAFQAGETEYFPFYISLGYFENAPYDDENIYEQAKALMTKEMSEYVSFLRKNPSVTPVIFVNEIREHSIGRANLENALFDVMKENGIIKRVVTIDTGLVRDRSKLKKVIPIASGRTHLLFESGPVDAHDEEAVFGFIEAVTAFYDCRVDTGALFNILKDYKYQDLDAFIIRSIAEELISSANQVSNIGETYEKWALTEYYGDEEKLFSAAEKTFQYMFKEDLPLASVHFNDPQWSLLHQHQSFIDFLLAYYIVKSIDFAEREDDVDCTLFGVMLTSSTTKFIDAFLSDDYQLQNRIFHVIVDNYDAFSTVQKSSANFWLAKLTFKNLIGDAAAFLRKRFEELKPLVKNKEVATQENYDNQFLFRSVCITLVTFGQTSILDDYLCIIVTNDAANAINRGATVEYYGEDYSMAENGTYYLDTDITLGDKAIKALSWKINKVLLPQAAKFPELDLLTLSTLLQERIQSNESKALPEINKWVSEGLNALRIYQNRPQNIRSEKIEYYFSSVSDDFENFLSAGGKYDVSQHIYNALRGLKDIKRRQWLEKNIADPESVSEHSYSAWMLAMLFLPNKLNHEDYIKHEVLDMLLIHDMAEAKLGDQVLDLSEPSRTLNEHNKIMRKLFVKGTYTNVANLTYYYNIWTGYYYGVNINAKIARDINLIQSTYTFCEYCVKYPNQFTDVDRAKWMREKGKLETDIGYEIYEKLVENNVDFEGVFNRVAINCPSHEPYPARPSKTQNERQRADGNIRYRVMGYDDIINSNTDIEKIREEILAIVRVVITSDNNQIAEENLTMLESISENWRVILDSNNELVAYWVFVALQDEYFEMAKAGALNEADITLNTIEFIDLPGDYHGYLLLSGAKPEARTSELVQLLYKSLAVHIGQLSAKGIFFDEICAVGESPAGSSALKKMGLVKTCEHQYGGYMYACSMRNVSENPFFSQIEGLRAAYEAHFGKQHI